jgi:hypothetical protein
VLGGAGAQQQDAEQGSDTRERQEGLQGRRVYNAVPWRVNGSLPAPASLAKRQGRASHFGRHLGRAKRQEK